MSPRTAVEPTARLTDTGRAQAEQIARLRNQLKAALARSRSENQAKEPA